MGNDAAQLFVAADVEAEVVVCEQGLSFWDGVDRAQHVLPYPRRSKVSSGVATVWQLSFMNHQAKVRFGLYADTRCGANCLAC